MSSALPEGLGKLEGPGYRALTCRWDWSETKVVASVGWRWWACSANSPHGGQADTPALLFPGVKRGQGTALRASVP